jgi:molybdopterin synthase sulfur carrier subunit
MLVTVKLFAAFRTGRFDVAQQEHPAGTTVGGIVDALGIPRAEIGILMVSGRHADLDERPAPGDTVAIFPLIGGG